MDRAIGEVLDEVLAVLHALVLYVGVGAIAAAGVKRTLAVGRRWREAAQLGRAELLRRLAVVLSSVEERAHERDAQRVADVADATESGDATCERPLPLAAAPAARDPAG